MLFLAAGGCGRLQKTSAGEENEAAAGEAETIRQKVESRQVPAYAHGDEGVHLWKTVRRFYSLRDFRPVWVVDSHPTSMFDKLVAALGNAPLHGLDARAYDLDQIRARRKEAGGSFLRAGSYERAKAIETEIWLTYSCLKYASHLLRGRIDPEEIDPLWYVEPRKVDLANALNNAAQQGEIEETLEQLAPQDERYGRLMQTLARYRDIEARGGWPALPDGAQLKPGQRSPNAALLRKRLALTGDSTETGENPGDLFDGKLEEAVKKFQRRHGMQENGVVDRKLIGALNVPVQARIRQIELNMERWRWLPADLGSRYILINIPDFHLDVVEKGTAVLPMRVVVGKTFNPTPVFSDQMTHIIFSPYWNIPESIVKSETLPAIQRDPGYLERQNIEIVRNGQVLDPSAIDWSSSANNLQFRQKPGTKNALGLVKFMFPNQFNVYLHDTPSDSLFERTQRSFSHGCIRIEKPLELAQYLLKDQPEWSRPRIEAAMQSGTEQTVNLKQSIPVHIVYWTTWVEKDGTVQFRDDVYGHDAKQGQALQREIAAEAA